MPFHPLSISDPNGTAPGEPYRMYNLDVFEYLSDSPFGLYGSIPLLMGHRPAQTSAVFWWVQKEGGGYQGCGVRPDHLLGLTEIHNRVTIDSPG